MFCIPDNRILDEITEGDTYHCCDDDDDTCWFNSVNTLAFYRQHGAALTDHQFANLILILWRFGVKVDGFCIYENDDECEGKLLPEFTELLRAMHADRHDLFHKAMDATVSDHADGEEEYVEYREIWDACELPVACRPESISAIDLDKWRDDPVSDDAL